MSFPDESNALQELLSSFRSSRRALDKGKSVFVLRWSKRKLLQISQIHYETYNEAYPATNAVVRSHDILVLDDGLGFQLG